MVYHICPQDHLLVLRPIHQSLLFSAGNFSTHFRTICYQALNLYELFDLNGNIKQLIEFNTYI